VLTSFPLTGPVFEHQFGVSAFPIGQPIFVTDALYNQETQLRRELLASTHRDDYLVEWSAGSDLRDVFCWICDRSDSLSRRADGVQSRLSKDRVDEDRMCLEWLGRNLQEDIVLLADDLQAGYPTVAGCVCFPSGWTLRDKVGQSLVDVHAEVPEYRQQLHSPTEKLFSRLRLGKTVWRSNWGVRPSRDLDQSPRRLAEVADAARQMQASEVGHRCFFRVETQTITRLRSGFILFTIRTRQSALGQLSGEQKQRLRGVLATCPTETLRYKGVAPMLPSIQAYLNAETA